MKLTHLAIAISIWSGALGLPIFSQTAPPPPPPPRSTEPSATLTTVEGHWEGTVQMPGNPISFTIDLQSKGPNWIGSFGMPAQKLSGMPLADIGVQGDDVHFEVKDVPGKPVFTGKRAQNGKIAGTVTQAGTTLSFEMSRTGEAKVELPATSTPITKEMEGDWEGVINMGKPLRIVLHLVSAGTTSSGSVDSPDQNAAGIAITTITQTGRHLAFDIKLIGGSYSGDLNQDGTELTGQWSQGGNTAPLNFKRAGTAPKP